MKLSDMDKVHELVEELAQARRTTQFFHADMSAMFPCMAVSMGRGASVYLLPVPREQVLSACQRLESKIIDKLRALGMEVD